MLTVLKDRPSVFKDAAVNDPVYLQGENTEGIYGYMLLNFTKDTCAVHLTVLRWGASVLKEMKEDWKKVMLLCRERGCKELLAMNQNENDKWYKLIGYFGFDVYTEVRVYHQEVV